MLITLNIFTIIIDIFLIDIDFYLPINSDEIEYLIKKYANHNIFLYIFIADQLLNLNAFVNIANEHGNTPLHYACFWSYEEICRVSIRKSLVKFLLLPDSCFKKQNFTHKLYCVLL